MLRTIGLITVIYFALIACGISPQGVIKRTVRNINHSFMTPQERQVARVTEPVADAVDSAKAKAREALK